MKGNADQITDDEIALWWQSLHKQAMGDEALGKFLAKVNASVSNRTLHWSVLFMEVTIKSAIVCVVH